MAAFMCFGNVGQTSKIGITGSRFCDKTPASGCKGEYKRTESHVLNLFQKVACDLRVPIF